MCLGVPIQIFVLQYDITITIVLALYIGSRTFYEKYNDVQMVTMELCNMT